MLQMDLRPYLSGVSAPVIVVRPKDGSLVPLEGVRWLVDHLPDARLIEVDGSLADAALPGGPVLAELEELVAGTRTATPARRELRAILVTDLVGSTALLRQLGDEGWRRLLASHRAVVRTALARYQGTEIDTAGDEFLATFTLPSNALRCAMEIRDVSRTQGVAVRQGLHAGEVSVLSDGIAGGTVHAAARVSALAGAGEILLTETILQMFAGDTPSCEPAGSRVLRGLPGRWRLHRVADASHTN
ncbi:adenylate/guanylate cyclase domain-containing protein [Puerhibacterium puerhi]|uniref:adenylate/guanylate cyclase domain-containing protein n=1 Tax=Puerhibacterium puerhi TaxID=2692623 RepID=UPI00135AAF4E|nr:adenylate/guanylate cyclase domain-containing protein [Puerhibacterium puerhi]